MKSSIQRLYFPLIIIVLGMTLCIQGMYRDTVNFFPNEKPFIAYLWVSPNGKKICAASQCGPLWLSDVMDNEDVESYNTSAIKVLLFGHIDFITTAVFSSDSEMLLTGSRDCTARLWDVVDGEERACFEGHSRAVNVVGIDSSNSLVLTGSDDCTLRLWRVEDGKQLFSIKHTASVCSASFNEDNQEFFSSSVDGRKYIWSLFIKNKTLCVCLKDDESQ
ncbi:hypothetical protein H0X06_05515 [Candidatus Dependentiae bacterium]|nr:hypothetical protein [Candidatus Dependentiae bacterium]